MLFVAAVGHMAEIAEHHPDILIKYRTVKLSLVTHDAGGLTEKDFGLAVRIDELVTYHYLEAELFRSTSIHPTKYWALTKTQRADLIWKTLFVENTPVSEATRGVVAVLQAFGLDSRAKTLAPLREFFAKKTLAGHIAQVFKLAGISQAVMTNDPLDPEESAIWNAESSLARRFERPFASIGF